MKPEQTAIEWLFTQLLPFLPFSNEKEREHFRKCLTEAKAMEREQHGHTWDEALKQMVERGYVWQRAITDFDDYWPQ